MTPDHPVVRGTAQNPDVYFQARESVNPFYANSPKIVQRLMDELGERTGRSYQLYEYHGAEDAEKVIAIVGSGCDAVQETVDFLNRTTTTKVGVLKVRLYRPFDASRLVAALPKTVKRIAVLDRTKEPGSLGEPLYLDVVTALKVDKSVYAENRFKMLTKSDQDHAKELLEEFQEDSTTSSLDM